MTDFTSLLVVLVIIAAIIGWCYIRIRQGPPNMLGPY